MSYDLTGRGFGGFVNSLGVLLAPKGFLKVEFLDSICLADTYIYDSF